MQGNSFQGHGSSGGGSTLTRVEKITDDRSPYYASNSDGLIILKTTQPARVYLPSDPPPGKSISIKAGGNVSDSASVTIFPAGATTIDGSPLFTLTFSYSAITLVSDGVGWIIL